ncbi:MAG: acyl--CoA ligase [Synergistaceae bacterium]|jgi:acyl-CoA synthetase (AMP-forming)/AMP-acid ligase II|nr:acyl--CoA ligase [Synergistaceae bacterium]
MLARIFLGNAEKYPGRTALWSEGAAMTYGELRRAVNKLSHVFLESGVSAGDHIGILLENNSAFVTAMLAIANIGAAMAPLSPRLPRDAIKRAFGATGVKHVIAEGTFFDEAQDIRNEVGGALLRVGDGELGEPMAAMMESAPDGYITPPLVTGDEPYILTMTSGSTGSPKPIVFSQRTKYDRVGSAAEIYGISRDDVVMAATPLYHSLAERLVLIPLLLGGTSVLLSRFTPQIWLDAVRDMSVSFTIAVSSQLAQVAQVLSDRGASDISSLRSIASSSAPMPPEVKSLLLSKLRCEIHENYGASEVSFISDLNITRDAGKLRSVGRPIPRVSVRIMREDGTEAGALEKGEIQCRTPFLFGGYYNQPERTNEAMRDGYFRTGDIGYMDEDGFLYYVGRIKEMIVTGAIKVYPSDIEDAVLSLDSVRECAAFGLPDGRLGEVAAVAVVPKAPGGVSLRDLKFHCLERLADYQMPRKYFIVDELPRNAMNKVMKGELTAIFSGDPHEGG